MPTLFDELSPPLSEEEAILAADRCLECGGHHAVAPCVAACPAGVDYTLSLHDALPIYRKSVV